MYYEGIEEEIIKEQFKHEGDIEILHRYQDKAGNTKVDICFCEDQKALWIAKFKGEYYGNMVKNIVREDDYTYMDVFYQLRENAIKTLKGLK